jgi:hypothetical protein
VADLQTLLDATAAPERIWAIPGVRRIGFGLKETAGEVQPRWVFRVYVEAKTPAAELRAEELIPPTVEGLETDVHSDHQTHLECGGPRLHPGQQISAVVLNEGHSVGTLGCLVQKGGTFNILTACHVINVGNKQEDVYQPERSECLGSSCSKPVGKAGLQFQKTVSLTVEGEARDYYVDCGLVSLVHGLSMENGLAHGSLDPNIRDLSTENVTKPAGGGVPVPTTPVDITKEGSHTGLTTGTVVQVCAEEPMNPGDPPVRFWYLIAKPVKGVHWSATYDIATDEPRSIEQILQMFKNEPIGASLPDPGGHPRRIRFEGTRFSEGRDSGAIWYDGSGRPVGLHFAGAAIPLGVQGVGPIDVPTGRGKASHLTAVFSALGLDPATGIVTGAKDSAGETLPVPPAFSPSTAELERELGRSETGRELLADIGRRQEEVRRLIDHDRRVTLVWHRHKGPAYVATVINLAREGREEIPREVAGVGAVDLIRAMLDVLERRGSTELRETVERRRALLLELVESCDDLGAVVAHLEREASGVA